MPFKFIQTSFNDPSFLEMQSIQTKTLTGAIDIFWLEKTFSSTPFLLKQDAQETGYCVINTSNELMEFYVIDPDVSAKKTILHELIHQKKITSAIVSTRNPGMLTVCLDQGGYVDSTAYLFVDYQQLCAHFPTECHYRLANIDDFTLLSACYSHRSAEILKKWIDAQTIFLLFKKEKMIGIGRLALNVLQPQYCDVGASIEPPYQNQGLGTQLILQLKEECYRRGLIPTCGCDKTNLASKRMLEKAGFCVQDRMLKITFCLERHFQPTVLSQ